MFYILVVMVNLYKKPNVSNRQSEMFEESANTRRYWYSAVRLFWILCPKDKLLLRKVNKLEVK